MLLKGYTVGGLRVDFTLSDAPVLIDDTLVALTGCYMSDLIKYDSIVRGDETTMVFEGDLVYDEEELLGYVIYAKGLFLQKINGGLKNIPMGRHIHVREGNIDTIKNIITNTERTNLVFGYKSSKVTITSILRKKGDYIMLNGYNKWIAPKDLQFFTGIITSNKRYLFFGDTYDGGTIVLNNYIPSIQLSSGEFKDLEI